MIVRNIVIVVVALSAGVAGGVVFAQTRLGGQLQSVAAERDTLASKQAALERQLSDLQMLQKGLENDKQRLQKQLESFANQPVEVAEPQEQPMAEVAEVPAEMPEQPAPADNASMRDGRRDRRGGPGEEATPEEQEAWRQEREQRMTEFRDRMGQFFAGEMEKTNDPAVQQRLSQISEYSQYSMDLRRQMREAQTDEERQALSEQFEQVANTTRTLVKEQQDYLLRQSLASNGVTDAATQDAMINSYRTTMESPFFRMPMGGGPGGGPWGGGWGGRGSRGGGGGGQ
ncbi:MAG: hypothetical protein K1Y02_13865 [Candidatus Hydrogenedentes bacterium]|nr:hypothetical protein [Candidatus Hydrogenedentota bacterium]